MRVLIACEFSGVVRDAFIRRGHDAMSCDLLPTERPGPHYQGDVFDIIKGTPSNTYNGVEFCDLSAADKESVNAGIIDPDSIGWDLMVAHPPCTYLCRAGWHWVNRPDRDTHPLMGEPRRRATKVAARFFMRLLDADISRIAIENPVAICHAGLPKYTQIIHPWQFGHGETKGTCLWLKGLPELRPTNIVEGRKGRIFRMPPSPDRSKERSRSYEGIADAMAEQWGVI